MSWKVDYAEPQSPLESHKPEHMQKPEQLQFYHTESENHFIYTGESNADGEFFAVAYIGDAHPDRVVKADERKEFESWQETRQWIQRTKKMYKDGLDADKPDVFDGRD